jgi:hypothetical protein
VRLGKIGLRRAFALESEATFLPLTHNLPVASFATLSGVMSGGDIFCLRFEFRRVSGPLNFDRWERKYYDPPVNAQSRGSTPRLFALNPKADAHCWKRRWRSCGQVATAKTGPGHERANSLLTDVSYKLICQPPTASTCRIAAMRLTPTGGARRSMPVSQRPGSCRISRALG